MDVCFDVCKQVVTRTDTEKVVNLSDNYLRLVFDFKGTDWDNLEKFVLVHHRKGVTRLALDDDKVILSDGLLYGNVIELSLYGVDDPSDTDYRITANKIRLYLGDSGYVDEYSDVVDVIDIKTVREMNEEINSKANTSDMTSALAGKVDKVAGKSLSSNDYTDSDKNIVSHIEDDLEQVLQHLESTVIDSINVRVKYTDVKDNLTSSDTDKPLSAKQGKILKDTVDLKANTSDMTTALNGKSNVGHTHTKSDVTDLPTVATTGKYDDLTGIPVAFPPELHTHYQSEINDFSHNHDERYYTESEVDIKLNGKANSTHSHTKSDITDFTHTHTKSDISDFSHNHDERYYTETEVDTIITNLKNSMNNRCSLNSDKSIIQTGDTANLTAYVLENGAPLPNREVKFYKVTED